MKTSHILAISLLMLPFLGNAYELPLTKDTTPLPAVGAPENVGIMQVGDVTVSPNGDVTAGDVTVSNDTQTIKAGDVTVSPDSIQVPGMKVTGNTITAPGITIQTDGNKNMVEVDISKIKENSGEIVVTINGATVSTNNVSVDSSDGAVKITKDGNGNTITINSGDMVVSTTENLSVTNGSISVITPKGDVPLSVSPKEALEALELDTTDNTEVKTIELAEENGKALYRVTASEFKKLFGIFPVTLETTGEVSATEKTDVVLNKPWWSFLAF